MPHTPTQPRLTITLLRSQKPNLQLPVYVRELPGLLAPPPPSTGAGLAAAEGGRRETVDQQPADATTTEVEIDPLALRDLASFRTFLARIADVGRPVHLWCWDARLQRLLTITGAADATAIEINLSA
jgi:hypothetical protein